MASSGVTSNKFEICWRQASLPGLKKRVHAQPLVTIPQGQAGYVFARDGAPLGPTQTLASNAMTADFLEVRAFLSGGGQKGPQRTILREGTYAINLVQFVIVTRDQTMA